MAVPLGPSPISTQARRRISDLARLLRRGKSPRGLPALARHFFKNAPDTFAPAYRPKDIQALLSSAYRVMRETKGRTVAVSVYNPEESLHGFSSDRTIIQISAPDGPFYVTSVRERLRSMGHAIVHLIHPILPVRWDSRGRLAALGDVRGGPPPTRQSLIHIEIDRVDDKQQILRITREIRALFVDLRLVVRDFDRMRAAIEEVRRDESGAGKSKEDVRQLSEFLRWLADGNFVFLGYREYDLLPKNGRKFYSLRHGTGLGVMTRERESRFYRPVPFSRLSLMHRRGLLSRAPYVILQTNRPSPVYRRERMIYIGVKKYSAKVPRPNLGELLDS